jgi:HD-GYP domain-containing protein (c-di-GMP phosphodiesterase class II)
VVFRLLSLLGGLSVVTDLGTGAPMEESLKRSLVAARLARAIGCADAEVSEVIYTSLLQHLGCTAYAHELAGIFGDDITATRMAFLADLTRPRDVVRTFIPGVAEATGRTRAAVAASLVTGMRRLDVEGQAATCEVACEASRRLGLPPPVQAGLFNTLAMWNGKGYPKAVGDAIPLSARLMHVASTAVLAHLHIGERAAVAEVMRRSGSYLDPELADAFLTRAGELLDGLSEIDAHREMLDAEPDPVQLVDDTQLESVARTFGDLVDLKSPFLHGHSAAVADLAAAAAGRLGLADDVRTVQIAGHLHDAGRVGVSSRIWDKPGPLTESERDQVRLHPYHTERILARVPELAGVAALAGGHHERCDGSGYHRGVHAAQQAMPARVLAAADAYHALLEPRPHRAAASPSEAAARLRSEATAGRLDGDAVAAVLDAAGHRTGLRRPRPCDLTERQVEVLRMVAAGRSNAQIAERLVISRRTAEHHVQDVYAKIGVSTRAGAAMFAMEHGLADKPG